MRPPGTPDGGPHSWPQFNLLVSLETLPSNYSRVLKYWGEGFSALAGGRSVPIAPNGSLPPLRGQSSSLTPARGNTAISHPCVFPPQLPKCHINEIYGVVLTDAYLEGMAGTSQERVPFPSPWPRARVPELSEPSGSVGSLSWPLSAPLCPFPLLHQA